MTRVDEINNQIEKLQDELLEIRRASIFDIGNEYVGKCFVLHIEGSTIYEFFKIGEIEEYSEYRCFNASGIHIITNMLTSVRATKDKQWQFNDEEDIEYLFEGFKEISEKTYDYFEKSYQTWFENSTNYFKRICNVYTMGEIS